ncbi:MAG: GNAT family N-acetyltransferase [Clostridiales bacterium]|nr:GNAT family N-acetyltransferase [Clostridiales bacterium]
MELQDGEYLFSDDKTLLSIDAISGILSKSYWAGTRSIETIEQAIDNSMSFGVYHNGRQIGFTRVVTDYSTMYWVCDVIIDESYRGKGIGKKLMDFVLGSRELAGLKGILRTKDAHGLYEQNGFIRDGEHFMIKP